MAEGAGGRAESFHGLPSRLLTLPNGDRLRVLLHGAQVVSWVAAGRERLYLSPRSIFDGQAAIRGGIPICFPQFNRQGPLPKHGFARKLRWQPDEGVDAPPGRLSLKLDSDGTTLALWPHAFEARITLDLAPGTLQVTLAVANRGETPLEFTGALHTYLAVDDIAAVALTGLGGQPEWDTLTDTHRRATEALRFDGAFDRVYDAAGQPLVLRDGANGLAIGQSGTWAQTVVWNPGAPMGAPHPDLPADGHTRMLCVEAAQVTTPVVVPPAARWQGWQRLAVC